MNMKIKIDDKYIEYYKFGSGKKIMVMIPGIGIRSCIPLGKSVEAAYKQFSDEFTVYLIERANELKINDSLKDIASDYIKVFEVLRLNNIYLMGASFGGMIGQVITELRNDLINKLVIVSSTCHQNGREDETIAVWSKLAKANKIEELTIHMLNHVYSENIAEMLKENTVKDALTLTDKEIERFIVQDDAMISFSGSEELKVITCPTLIIAAKGDKVFDYKDSIYLNENIKNSKLYLYEEDKPHAIYDEVLEVKEKVYDFFME